MVNMSLNVRIELPVDTVLAIQNAIRLGGDPLQTARTMASHAVVDAVKQLPYDIMPKASGSQAETAPPDLEHIDPSPSLSPPPTKRMRYEPDSIHFFVRKLTGKELTINLPLSSTIKDLKREIEEMEDLPPHMQRFIFAGQQLEDGRRLDHVSSHSNHIIVM